MIFSRIYKKQFIMVYYINYKDEKHPLFISHYAMKMLYKETGKTVDDVLLDNAGFNELTEVFLYYCLEAGYRKEKKCLRWIKMK